MGKRVVTGWVRPRGTNGRFEKKERPVEKEPEAEAENQNAEKPMTPAQCRIYLRRKLGIEFKKIVDGFVKEAKNGGCMHVKLANELLKPEERPRQKKGPVARMLEELKEIETGEATADAVRR